MIFADKLGGAADTGVLHMRENVAGGLGCVVLLLMIAAAVGIFVSAGTRMSGYEAWEKLPLDTAYGVDGVVRDRMGREAPAHTRRLVTGVGLCVLCPTPLFLMMALNPADWPMIMATAALLAMVALGVGRLVETGVRWESFGILLETGEHTRERKQEDRRNGLAAGIYWGSAVAIYLAWSFLTGDWARTWILWPVAGVSYGVLVSVLRAVRSRR